MGVFSKNKLSSSNSNGEATNIVSHGTVITGDIESEGNFRLEGKLKGNITTKAKIFIGKTGEIIGDIRAENAVIQGQVKGDLEIINELIVKEKCIINGDIKAQNLTAEKGSKIRGQVDIHEDNSKSNDSKPSSLVSKKESINGQKPKSRFAINDQYTKKTA